VSRVRREDEPKPPEEEEIELVIDKLLERETLLRQQQK
jgi:hypothetical protein